MKLKSNIASRSAIILLVCWGRVLEGCFMFGCEYFLRLFLELLSIYRHQKKRKNSAPKSGNLGMGLVGEICKGSRSATKRNTKL
ncbi:hypothetical protein HOY82DRAFT_24322 [Tuber indicum]|nr:hypothetical protein HOY82DRAFT_24322 [Tuber indicum]